MAQMNNYKKKADLRRITNLQQAVQKATIAILKSSDKLMNGDLNIQPKHQKELLADNVDVIALLGHADNKGEIK